MLIALAEVAVPLVVGAGIALGLRLRRGRRRKQLLGWTQRLGWRADDEGTLRGLFEGQRVELEIGRRGRLLISVLLRPALDLGLQVVPHGAPVVGDLPRVRTGDARFDGWFRCRCPEPERAKALLTPELTDAIDELGSQCKGLTLTDERLRFWLTGGRTSRAEVEKRLGLAAKVIRLVERERRRVPVSWQLEPFVEDWRRFAAEHGLELYRAPLGLFGTLRGREVCAVAVRVGDDEHLLDVLAWFEPPLGFALTVKPSDPDVRRGGAKAGPVPDFGSAFEVEHADERGQQLLAGGIGRELAKTQARHGPTTLTSDWLWVRVAELPARPDQALEVMEVVAELGHEIAIRARQLAPDRRGPYRGRQ